MNNIDFDLIGREYNAAFMLRVGAILFALLAGTAVLWGFNISGLLWVNLIPFFLGFIWLLVVGSSPAAIGLSAFTGSFIRTANLGNPLAGANEGVKFWLTVILPAFILAFCAMAGFLATWPFQNNPVGFWYVAAASIVIATATILFKKNSDILYKIVVGYSTLVVIISLASSFINFDVKSWFGSEESAKVADISRPTVEPCTGEFAEVRGCRMVTLTGDQTYKMVSLQNQCPTWTPAEDLEVERNGNAYTLRSISGNTEFMALSVPKGTTFNGFTCR